MALPVSTIPEADRPRERLWSLGPAALTTAELLAIVLGTGGVGQDVLELARQLLEVSEGSLRRLAQRPSAELLRSPGVGPTKAGRLIAAFELGARERPPHTFASRRINRRRLPSPRPSPEAYERRATGAEPLRAIAAGLNARGIPTARRNGQWSACRLRACWSASRSH